MQKSFEDVLNYWHNKFGEMKPGEAREIGVVGKRDPELFRDICKMFIDAGNPDFNFTNDYKYFRRGMKWPE